MSTTVIWTTTALIFVLALLVLGATAWHHRRVTVRAQARKEAEAAAIHAAEAVLLQAYADVLDEGEDGFAGPAPERERDSGFFW